MPDGGLSDTTTGSDINVAQLLTKLFAGSPAQTTTTSTPTAVDNSLQGIVDTANANATNPAITQNIVNNIMRQASIAFAPQLASAKSMGGYNSATINLLAQQAVADTTNRAAQATLNYTTDQQKIAASGEAELASLNKSTTVTAKPAIPNALSIPLAIAGVGMSALSNAKTIGKLITDPVGTISDKLGLGAGAGDPTKVASIGDLTAGHNIGGSLEGGFGPSSQTQLDEAVASGEVPITGAQADDAVTSITPLGSDTFDTAAGLSASDAVSSVGDLSSPLGIASGIASLAGAPPELQQPLNIASDVATAANVGTSLFGGAAADVGAPAADTAVSDTALSGGLTSADISAGGTVASVAGDASVAGAGADLAGGTAAAGDAILGGAAIEGGADIAAGAGTAVAGDAILGGAAAEGGADIAAPLIAAAAWIVCTELTKQGRMPYRWYVLGAPVFASYPAWATTGYYIWAIPCVRHLRAKPNSWFSNTLEWVFNKRAQYIASWKGHARRTISGMFIYYALNGASIVLSQTVCKLVAPPNWQLLYKEIEGVK